MKSLSRTFIIALSSVGAGPCAFHATGAPPSASLAPPVDFVAQRGREIQERYISAIYPDKHPSATVIGADQAYTSLFLHRSDIEVQDTNEKLTTYLKPFVADKYWITTKEEDFRLYWSQTMLIKLLLDPATRTRLSPENQRLIKQLLWNFVEGFGEAYVDYDFASADPSHVPWIFGSDNHDMIRRGFFFFACQLLKDDPEFASQKVPGGGTLATLYIRWVANLKLYFQERAAAGLTAEIGSPTYVGVYLQPIFLMADYAEDKGVQSLAKSFLDLTFADAAQETINGVRGGARCRAYKNKSAYNAQFDTFILPIYLLTGLPSAGSLYPLRPGNIPSREGACLVALDTRYRLPQPILDLFTARASLGSFQFDSERPATGSNFTAWQRDDPYPVYVPLRPSRLVRSTWVTPDSLLGWFTIDESQPTMLVHDQNQWMGAITSVDNGRIAITGTPTSPDGRTSYSDLQAVGHHQAIIIRRSLHVHSHGCLRIFFSSDFKLTNKAGWLLAQTGNNRSWFALKAVEIETGTVRDVSLTVSDWGTKIPGGNVNGSFYTINNLSAYLVVDSGSLIDGSYDQFTQKVTQPGRITISSLEPGLTYRPISGDVPLTIYNSARTPQIGHDPIGLPPRHVFSSPFLQSSEHRNVFTVHSPTGNQYVIQF